MDLEKAIVFPLQPAEVAIDPFSRIQLVLPDDQTLQMNLVRNPRIRDKFDVTVYDIAGEPSIIATLEPDGTLRTHNSWEGNRVELFEGLLGFFESAAPEIFQTGLPQEERDATLAAYQGSLRDGLEVHRKSLAGQSAPVTQEAAASAA